MKVLIVDDNEQDRKVLRYYLESHKHAVVEAKNGLEGLEASRREAPDMVISDALMPVMDGFRALRELKKDSKTKDIPFIFYSAVYTDEKDEVLAQNLGAAAFIVKPKDPEHFWRELTAALKKAADKGGVAERMLLEEEEQYLARYSEVVTSQLEKKVVELEKANTELAKMYEIMKVSLNGTVEAVAAVAERKDPYTIGHERRVVELSLAIGRAMGLKESELEGLRIAATLHDVGKINIPSEILSKPGKLSDLEFGLIKAHPTYSYEVLSKIEFPWPVAEIALQHHERVDGSGYPKGLAGKDIMVEAKIIAVADVIEAMASHRPYRRALPINEALEEIDKGKGKLYDDTVAKTALDLFKKGYKLAS